MANNLKDHLKEVADAIRAKKGTNDLINPQDFATEIEGISGGGSGEGSGSNIEYLDVRDSPIRDALIMFCYLIKTDGFNIERPNGIVVKAERGIIPGVYLMQVMIDITLEEYSIITDSIKAVTIDYNTEVVMDGTTIVSIKDILAEVEELLDSTPRLTKEQFYNLNA